MLHGRVAVPVVSSMLSGAVASAALAQWTVINLNPAGSPFSQVNGASSVQQVGYATIGAGTHAGLWTGTAASWVDLRGDGVGRLGRLRRATGGVGGTWRR